MNAVTVRAYRQSDREAVRRICCDTAFYGEPIERVFEDRAFMSEALIGYYTEFETDSMFVADSGGRVIGYVTGCLDTQHCERVYLRHIVPRLARLFVMHGHWLRISSWRMLVSVVRSGRQQYRDRPSIAAAHPAHCHVNLEAAARRSGTGSILLETFFNLARSRRVRGVHVSTATDQGRLSLRRRGFERSPATHCPGCRSLRRRNCG